jgi:NAD-dependent SIR2 family protein deacetylase
MFGSQVRHPLYLPNNATIFDTLFQGHVAIAECEKRLAQQGRRVLVITQNIDELHKRSGSENILELHGKRRVFQISKLLRIL